MIELNGIYDAYKVRGTASSVNSVKQPRKTEYTREMTAAGRADTGVDVIEISPNAALKAQTKAVAKQYAAQENGVSAERIAALRKKYADNSCPVSAEATAQAILNRIMG